LDERERRLQILRECEQFVGVSRLESAHLGVDRAKVSHRFDDVAGTGLALGTNKARALADTPQRLAQVRRAAHEGHGEAPLVDVVLFVSRRQDLGFVDVVDVECFEDLRLGEVADTGLGHDRNRDRGLDPLNHLGIAHARHAAVASDVRRHALEGHDRYGARVLGDLRLFGLTTSMMTPPRSMSARPRSRGPIQWLKNRAMNS